MTTKQSLIKKFNKTIQEFYTLHILRVRSKHHLSCRDRKSFLDKLKENKELDNELSYLLYNNVLSVFETSQDYISFGFRFPSHISDINGIKDEKIIHVNIHSVYGFRRDESYSTYISLNELEERLKLLKSIRAVYDYKSDKKSLSSKPNAEFKAMFLYCFKFNKEANVLVNYINENSEAVNHFIDCKVKYKAEKYLINKEDKERKRKNPPQDPRITQNKNEIKILQDKINQLHNSNRAIESEINKENNDRRANLRELEYCFHSSIENIYQDYDLRRAVRESQETSAIGQMIFINK